MYPRRTTFTSLRVLGLAAIAFGVIPSAVQAQPNTCNGNVVLNYTSGPNFADVGSVYRVKIDLGANASNNATTLTVNRLRFELDCQNAEIPCTDDAALMQYQGDATITTDCTVSGNPVGFTTGHAVSSAPNTVTLTPTTAIVIPVPTASFCSVEFDVMVLAISPTTNPGLILQAAGYQTSTADGQCNNGLNAGDQGTGSIPVCPSCEEGTAGTDGNFCTGEACNTNTGACDLTGETTDAECFEADADKCTGDICQTATGACVPSGSNTTDEECFDAEADKCTGDICETSTGACTPSGENTTDTECFDAEADKCTGDICETSTGACSPSGSNTTDTECFDADANKCTGDICQTTTGACVAGGEITTDAECFTADPNKCTGDICETSTGACIPSGSNTTDTECFDADANKCTGDICQTTTGACVASGEATTDTECFDADPNKCTGDICQTTTGACVAGGEITTDAECFTADPNKCTGDICETSTGACVAGGEITTDAECFTADADKCTGDICQTTTGACVASGSNTTDAECFEADANKCTGDICQTTTGACVPSGESTTDVECADADLCTQEVCDTSTGQCAADGMTSCAPLPDVCCDPEDGMCKADPTLDPTCAGAICRTPGFWGTHGDITLEVLGDNGVTVCGHLIDDISVDSRSSALEAICNSTKGEPINQLIRQLTSAALNNIISGGGFNDTVFNACDAACVNDELTAEVNGNTINCIDAIDCANNGGNFDEATGDCAPGGEDNCHERELCNEEVGLCFVPPGPASSPKTCNQARKSACTVAFNMCKTP